MTELAVSAARGRMLIAIKALHTGVWVIQGGAIVSLPFLAWHGRLSLGGDCHGVGAVPWSCDPVKRAAMPVDRPGSKIHGRPVAELRCLRASLAGAA